MREKGGAVAAERHDEVRRGARAEFDHWAHGYDRSRLNELVFFPTIRAVQQEVIRLQHDRRGKPFRLLDVGCGTGRLITLLALRDDAELLVGLDYSPVMIQKAAARIADSSHRARLATTVGDAERLPFADASFDVVTCCNSFHHYPHQAAAVESFCRVLRPGGRLILIDGFRDNVIGWLIFDWVVTAIEKTVYHVPWREMRDMIRKAGFSHVFQRKLNVLAPLLISVATR